jgi:ubiquinone/menaquinone biosynthesis C-methylase UbiE
MFKTRSTKLERIDTGDYTAEEYDRFLEDIRLVNRFAGDNWALRKTLLREVENEDLREFSVLDIGAGSGELLRTIARFSRKQNRRTTLCGLELNKRSAESILEESINYREISSIRGDAVKLPFADNSFDYVISSLFTHHLTEKNIIASLREMSRVSKRKFFVIDLHRHPLAYASYKMFCVGFRISQLVREDGSLSILRGFKASELNDLAAAANLENISVKRHFPYRLVLGGN